MEEIWKDIKGYDGKYQVSDKGNIKNAVTEKILKQYVNADGYYQVSLYSNRDKKSKKKEVHRLVAENFLEEKQIRKEVNHIDGNKANNKVNNLEWITHKENIHHAWKNKLFEPVRKASKRYGKDNPAAKKIIQYDIVGNKVKEYDCIMDAARSTNINKTSIGKCCNKRQKTAGKFIWKFKE